MTLVYLNNRNQEPHNLGVIESFHDLFNQSLESARTYRRYMPNCERGVRAEKKQLKNSIKTLIPLIILRHCR